MKKAYICSPYSKGDISANKEYARRLTLAALNGGYAPITPHLYMTEMLDDRVPEQREQGMRAALALLADCDVLIVGCDRGISAGMCREIDAAAAAGKIIMLAGETALIVKEIVNNRITFTNLHTNGWRPYGTMHIIIGEYNRETR